MSYEHDFLDFCLSCDRSTSDGPYCSNACRLADCEKSGSPSVYSSSPDMSLHNRHSPSTSWSSSTSGAFLPPAVDFSSWARKDRPTTSVPSSSRTSVTRSPSISSTQSSASTGSAHTCTMSCMSESARKELRHYESLFDQTRHRSSSYLPSRQS